MTIPRLVGKGSDQFPSDPQRSVDASHLDRLRCRRSVRDAERVRANSRDDREVRPFYERYFNSSDILPVPDVNRFGVSIGASILF
jgi:hypothetical protein